MQLLRRVAKPLESVLEKLRENVPSSEWIMRTPLLGEFNKLLKEHGLPNVEPHASKVDAEDDVPF